MRVSVIVPTTLRETAIPALQSIRAQLVDAELEVVLVIDLPAGSSVPKELITLSDLVIFSGGVGGAGARNAGVSASSGDYVAFLDDDDEWEPGKLQDQLQLIDDPLYEYVLTCRVRQGVRATGALSRPIPDHFWTGELAKAEEYLFVRRKPSLGRAVLYTSTLVVSRALALRVPWTEGLKRHQDWDWLMRLSREPGVRFRAAEQVGVRIWMNSDGSLSASSDWRSSAEWIASWSDDVSPRVRADFLAAQSLRYAILGRSSEGVRKCMNAIFRTRRLPSPGPILIALSGVIPRAPLSRVVLGTRRRTR